MNKLLVCAALGLALAVTEISAKPCSSFTGEKCRKKGCDWSKSEGNKFKTCKEIAPVVETPVVEGDASVCAQYRRGKGCRKAGCAFTRKNGKKSGKRTCNPVTPAPTSAPTPAPTQAFTTATDSESPSESPSPYAGPWVYKEGCCRDSESKDTTKGMRMDLTVGANATEALAECAEICASPAVVCSAFELTTKKKRGNKAKSMYICELHNVDVDKTTRKSKSCKRAVCYVNAAMISSDDFGTQMTYLGWPFSQGFEIHEMSYEDDDEEGAIDSGCTAAHADLIAGNDGCCSPSNQCYPGEGDCDDDSDCKGSGTCGTDNCPWGDNDDCCDDRIDDD